jgi:2-polyprenyl-3-methyl-5-hydroxy-6-metoxy-1,4-benzoquinol methylase
MVVAMATDCFGIEIDQTEYDNWEMLTKGPSGFAEPEGPVDLSAVVIAQNWPPAHLPLPDGILQDARVLEFGCGSGAHLPQVVVRGAMYTGIDISEWSLHCARTRYGHWQQVTLLHTIQDCEQILGMAGELDVVFGTNFFIHQPDERFVKMVETAMLLLRPGGWLSIDRRIGPMTDLGPEQCGVDWRGFQRDRADECAIATAAGLTLVAYTQPETMPLREYGIYRKLEHTE